MSERRPKDGREGSHCQSSDYTASTSPLIEYRYSNHTRLANQFIQKRDQHYYNSAAETSNTQSPQEDYENVTKMPCRFYGQVTYGKQLQAYVFTDSNAKVPAKNSMYVIFHEPTNRYFR